jgi:uncharacterized membrane protein
MKEKKIVWIGVFIIIQAVLTIILHSNFHTIFEAGLVEQSVWNTLKGEFFYSVSNGGNHFANHNSPILFLFLPLYYLISNILIFLITTQVFIAAGAIPIFLTAKKVLNRKAGYLFALSYLIFPSFFYTNIRTFHPIMLAVPFIGFMIYYFIRKDNKAILFAILAMMTNETISILIAFFGVYAIIKKRKIGLWLIIIGVIWFQFSTQIIIPNFGDYRFYGELYGHLGSNIGEILKTIITNPIESFNHGYSSLKVLYLLKLVGHNFFTILFAPTLLIPTIPVILQNIFSSSSYKYDFLAHYTYPLIPIIITGSILGVKKLSKKVSLKLILSLILISSLFSLTQGLGQFTDDNCLVFKENCEHTQDIIGNSPRENYPVIKKFIKEIPMTASVSAQNHVFNQISKRKETYLFERFNILDSDYIILDTTHGFHESILKDEKIIGYEVVKKEKDILLLKKDSHLFTQSYP